MSVTSPARRSGGQPRRAKASAPTREATLQRDLVVANNNLELLEARLRSTVGGISTSEAGVADLERQILGDPGWRAFAILQQQEFSPEGMIQLRAVCRLMSCSNPLMKRGLELRRVYVHGQGCEIRARATGRADKTSEQDVNGVIDRFIRNRTNRKTVFGQQAAGELEHALGTDGEVFIALYTRPKSGWVTARTFGADEITGVITSPDDRSEAWYYRRVWQRASYDTNGVVRYEQQELLYPDVDYRPLVRPASFAGVKVEWAAPVIHVAVNRPLNWQRGIPDAYAAINWTRAYKEFLEQWAGLMKSLAKFAWKLTTEGKNREQAKRAIAAAGASRTITGDSNDVGGTAITPLNGSIEAIPKSGATIDAMSGRPIAMMAAAGLGVPVTMLLNDPGQTGSRATAESLDWPTELTMNDRREIWSATRLRICEYVIAEAVRAPSGPLKGTIRRDEATGQEIVELAGDTDDTVDIVWPDLKDTDPKEIIDGIIAANAAGVIPPELILRHLLVALGVRDVDSILADMEDDDGNFQWPQTALTAGQQAADLARNGGDPADAGVGSMLPDGTVADPGGGNIPAGTPGPPGAGSGRRVPGQAGTAVMPADGPLARQADADFGLFGGSTPAGPAPDQSAGNLPDGEYDPDFFQVGPGSDEDTAMPDDQTPAPARRRTSTARTREADARQADADFGLGPAGTTRTDDQQEEPAGPEPASLFDPAFFTI